MSNTDYSVGIAVPKTDALPRQPSPMSGTELGQTVESLGYDSVWTSEGWGSDSFAELMEVAAASSDLTLGTSIVNVYSRTPAVLAMGAATVARATDGQMMLGVGASHPGLVSGLHGMDFERPLGRVKETIELVKAFTGDGDSPVEYHGEIFDVGGFPPQTEEVTVLNAALGEQNRRLTGQVANGWLPYYVPIPRLEEAYETIESGAEEVGRTLDDFVVTPWITTAVSEDVSKARMAVKRNTASYLGGFEDDSYRNAVGKMFSDEARAIAEAWRQGDEDAAAERVTDEMIEALTITGTPSDAREQLRELTDNPVIDTPVVSIPFMADDDLTRETIEALRPDSL